MEEATDGVTRCLQCGKQMVLVPSHDGRKLKCIFCDKLDPMKMPGAKQWADSPLAAPVSELVP
jgi:hypothetical protein